MESPDNDETWCVYALCCSNKYLYIGITNNLRNRLKAHNNGTGSKFVRSRRPFELMKVIQCNDAREARRLEYRLKKLKRREKFGELGIEYFDAREKLSPS